MTKTLLFVGNSHSACRYDAADVFHTHGAEFESVSWICQGAIIAPFELDREKNSITPEFSETQSALIQVYIKHGQRILDDEISKDDGIYLKDIQSIVVSSVGVRPPGVLLGKHICHYMAKVPCSDNLVSTWIENQPIFLTILPKLAELRGAGYTGGIFITPWIRPFELPAFCPIDIWERFCRLETLVLTKLFLKLDATLLPYPRGSEVLTDASLTNKKVGVHGNKKYGTAINEILLERLRP